MFRAPMEFHEEHISYIVRAAYTFGVINNSVEADQIWRHLYKVNRGMMPVQGIEQAWRHQELPLMPPAVTKVIAAWEKAHAASPQWDRAIVIRDVLERTTAVAWIKTKKIWSWVDDEWIVSLPDTIDEETRFEAVTGGSLGKRSIGRVDGEDN